MSAVAASSAGNAAPQAYAPQAGAPSSGPGGGSAPNVGADLARLQQTGSPDDAKTLVIHTLQNMDPETQHLFVSDLQMPKLTADQAGPAFAKLQASAQQHGKPFSTDESSAVRMMLLAKTQQAAPAA